ncbi:helix-turn-helix transcriptional regulator [Actinoplanes sp. NPDC023714]|uniref:helix-turn-helix domain-containing protein n=1 Tax=Actinoplanes sp. NPDC023714 TaxID=3154322 RepID=UPI0033E7C313
MAVEFSAVLQGLMTNRRITSRMLSRASERAESTINGLLDGRLAPTPEVLEYIAPALQIPLADLLVMAGLPTTEPPRQQAGQEIGSLLAAASRLTPQQVEAVTDFARSQRTER